MAVASHQNTANRAQLVPIIRLHWLEEGGKTENEVPRDDITEARDVKLKSCDVKLKMRGLGRAVQIRSDHYVAKLGQL